MTTIGILGAGQAGSTLARAAIAAGYDIVIANSRGPATLKGLVSELGPRARAASAADAAEAGAFAFTAFPYSPSDRLPVQELAGKVVIDNNNYMVWRDGNYPEVDSGRKTIHELRQEQLPDSKVAKAFSHIQFHERFSLRVPSDALPGLFRLARPAGAPDRKALVVSSNYPDAVELVTRFYDDLGFDAVDNSPLSESWRSAPGTPMWRHHVDGQSRAELIHNLQLAQRIESRLKERSAYRPG
ncbi:MULTISPECIES: NAD(P)-binding domain-containing protein [unclassified Arthrobacter]|uniref:NADPH-dependent F420 reductase n=1 Tax=unclassified Arthrobacter TaxID=235627 RepID=UPI0024E017B2|nr:MULTISPECIES: NAD(P)-binding domain-containing protein [unclassified Arthrobacter]MCC9145104.1 NAD(P)-binding domain-containing protein [Arthrobacter sp. zg-Y919]MDK1276332.1 NAD(P)-binding domain-containing protein [Arthrobacter sp. zg.Y919]WIB02064.1 NAD(P)-binding domain-containing protein [Arthrobacter sp. zg-Y919]